MTSITVDGLNEDAFRRSIERRMRENQADKAIEQLRALLVPYAGPGLILPREFRTISARNLDLRGWETLGNSIARRDRPGSLISALSIAFAWPGDDAPLPGADGCLTPYLETSYYTDATFPFSQSGRDDLLDGYSFHGCTWAGDSEASDTALTLDGIDHLHGALATLEARLLATDEPDADEIRAGSLGACLLSVLLFQAVGERIARDGLPRPVCVMAGSTGVYPYFDAPVVGIPDQVLEATGAADLLVGAADLVVPGPRYSSLLMTGIPRAKKRAVLVLQETEAEAGLRIGALRGFDPLAGAIPPIHRPSPDDLPSESLADPATPPPHGKPLLARKPVDQTWDFREMLTPRELGAETLTAVNAPDVVLPDGDHASATFAELPADQLEPEPAEPVQFFAPDNWDDEPIPAGLWARLWARLGARLRFWS